MEYSEINWNDVYDWDREQLILYPNGTYDVSSLYDIVELTAEEVCDVFKKMEAEVIKKNPDVEVVFTINSDYDYSYIDVRIRRYETDEEWSERIRKYVNMFMKRYEKNLKKKKALEAKELRELKRLKRKYGDV